MDEDPSTGFRKLNFLLSNPPFPPETFGNLFLCFLFICPLFFSFFSSPFVFSSSFPLASTVPKFTGNLLLLHCKFGFHDLAADILAENAHLSVQQIDLECFRVEF